MCIHILRRSRVSLQTYLKQACSGPNPMWNPLQLIVLFKSLSNSIKLIVPRSLKLPIGFIVLQLFPSFLIPAFIVQGIYWVSYDLSCSLTSLNCISTIDIARGLRRWTKVFYFLWRMTNNKCKITQCFQCTLTKLITNKNLAEMQNCQNHKTEKLL